MKAKLPQTEWDSTYLPKDDVDATYAEHSKNVTPIRSRNSVSAETAELLAQSPVVVLTIDANGLCTYLSRAWTEFTGQPLTDGIGLGWQDCIHPDDLPRLREQYALAGGRQQRHMEYRLRIAGGGYRWSLDTANSVHGEGTRLYICSIVDISHRAAIEAALKYESERKDRLITLLAQELRNPLAVVQSIACLLSQSGIEAPEHRRLFEILDRQSEKLSQVVNGFADIFDIARGALELDRSRVDMRGVIDKAVEATQARFDAHGQRVLITRPGKPLVVLGDQVRLEQVVVTLLLLAARSTPAGRSVDVIMEQNSSELTVILRNSCLANDSQMLAQVAELPRQANSLPGYENGPGMELTIVRSLVEGHRGRFEARSRQDAKGNEFVVILPSLNKLPQVGPPRSAVPAGGEASPRLQILVVDHNEDAAETFSMLLRSLGHDVEARYDSFSSLEYAKAERPHVVFIDTGLSGMDSYQVARILRADPPTAGAALVALVGCSRANGSIKDEGAVFDRHFAKPVDLVELESFLESVRANLHAHESSDLRHIH